MSQKSFLLILAFLFWPLWQAADAAAGRFEILDSSTIVDQAGRTIVVNTPFRRVISLYGAHTENLFALGLTEEIIGVSPHEDFPPQAAGKPVFSYHDDPEKFIAAQPDLILVRPMIDRGYPKFISMLEQAGATIVSLQPATVAEMHTYWEILGILTGKRDQALRMISRFQHTVSALKKVADARPDKQRVYFEAVHSKMKTFTPDSMAVFALESAGGINIAADAEAVRNTNIAYYGKERILSHAEEIDAYLAQYGAMNRPTVSMIRNETGFRIIKAVRQNKIFIIEEQLVSRPTMRLLEGIRRIGGILYPADFDDKTAGILKQYTEEKIED